MSRRRRFKMPTKGHSTFALNITSMTDMFTIMLVFLLQTYSTAEVEIKPENHLRLPTSNTTTNPVDGIRLTLSNDELKLDDKAVATLKEKQFASADVDMKDPNFLPTLFNELNKLNAADANKDPKKEGKILLQADAGLPYQTLRKVMYTASMAGFPQMKLVTMVGN